MEVAAYDERGVSLKLEGPSRAAVLLLALGPAGAGRLLKHFSHDEIRAVRRGAASQNPVSASELDALVSEFQEAFKTGPGISALDAEMQKLLQESLNSDDLSAILDEGFEPVFEMEPAASIWPQFEEQGAETLRTLLQPEHPQIVAIVLTRLSADTAALVVAGFDTPLRNDILRRLLVLRPLSALAETVFDGGFRELHLAGDERAGRSARHVGLAEIVNRMDKTQADELLASIAETQPDEVAAVRRLLFAFEDLPALTKKARLILFDDVSADMVVTALTNADEELKETILSSLAARARRMVEAELAQPRDLDQKDIVAARRAIAALALRLSNEGRIALTTLADEA